jgi:hypothetical protein
MRPRSVTNVDPGPATIALAPPGAVRLGRASRTNPVQHRCTAGSPGGHSRVAADVQFGAFGAKDAWRAQPS